MRPRPCPPRLCRARRGQTQRALTLIEITVAVVILLALIGFAGPRMLSGDTLGMDAKAKSTISTTADAVSTIYARQVAGQVWDPATLHADPDATEPLTADQYAALPRVMPYPLVGSGQLKTANPDLTIVDGETPSKNASTASVQSMKVANVASDDAFAGESATEAHHRVGIAVLAATDAGARTNCWMMQQALLPPLGVNPETYFVFEVKTAAQANWCTGTAAALLDAERVAAVQDNLEEFVGTAGNSDSNGGDDGEGGGEQVIEETGSEADEGSGAGPGETAGPSGNAGTRIQRGTVWSAPLMVPSRMMHVTS